MLSIRTLSTNPWARYLRISPFENIVTMMSELKSTATAKVADPEVNVGETTTYTDRDAERSYVRKIDFIVLPTLCLVGYLA